MTAVMLTALLGCTNMKTIPSPWEEGATVQVQSGSERLFLSADGGQTWRAVSDMQAAIQEEYARPAAGAGADVLTLKAATVWSLGGGERLLNLETFDSVGDDVEDEVYRFDGDGVVVRYQRTAISYGWYCSTPMLDILTIDRPTSDSPQRTFERQLREAKDSDPECAPQLAERREGAADPGWQPTWRTLSESRLPLSR